MDDFAAFAAQNANGYEGHDKLAAARARMDAQQIERNNRARAQDEELKELHRMEQQIRADAKQEELAKYMADLPEEEQRKIRLEIYLKYLDRAASGLAHGNERQINLDDLMIDALRYVVTGRV